MKKYRLKIKIKGFFANPITGDQLNGGFLYYLSLVNKDLFELFFEGFKKGKPPFIFSSFLPEGYLPINSQFIVYHILQELTKDETKILKKINFLPIDFFPRLSELKKDDFIKISENNAVKKEKLAKVSLKNDTLYNQQLISFTSKMADVYFAFDNFEFGDVKDYLQDFIAYFIGKKVSVGFSNFILVSWEELTDLGSGEYFINLSPFIPKKEEENFYQPLYFEFFTKYPKMGSLIGGGNPFKKKVILVKEGSVFVIKKEKNTIFKYAGLSLDNVSLSFPAAKQLCYTLFYRFSI